MCFHIGLHKRFGFYIQDELLSYAYIEAGMYVALVELLGLLLREYTTADYVPTQNVSFTSTW